MQTFPIPPATGKGVWILISVMILLLGVLVMLGWASWSTRHSRVEVGRGEIKLVGDLYGRRIPIERLELDQARIVNLSQDRDLVPTSRSIGTGLPGFASGWFRLRNGEKALIYLTNRERVVYVPTRDGYSLLLSQDDPEEFIAALRGG